MTKLKRVTDRRFDQSGRTKADKISRTIARLLKEIAAQEAETRRHMDVFAKAMHADFRRWAKRLGIRNDRFNKDERESRRSSGGRSGQTSRR